MASSTVPRVKPPALKPGDTIGIVAPASNVKRGELEAGCEGLRRAGYRPFYLDSILEQDLYFAGSVQRRARELEEMFARDEVRVIVCARGGYGANYLLEELDLEKIKAHPKITVRWRGNKLWAPVLERVAWWRARLKEFFTAGAYPSWWLRSGHRTRFEPKGRFCFWKMWRRNLFRLIAC